MSAEYETRDLRSELAKKNEENEDLKNQLQEVLSRFKDLKIKAERRAKLLHHVMTEYNAMTKEYNIMKSEVTAIQQRNTEMLDHMDGQEKRIEQLEQAVQILESENNELRRSRIIDASTKQWYGECNHNCSKHPRSFPHLHGDKEGELIEDAGTPCEICAEAEAWAQGMMDTPPKFTDSLRKNFQSTLPLRFRQPLSQSSQSTPFSTMRKPTPSDSSKGEREIQISGYRVN